MFSFGTILRTYVLVCTTEIYIYIFRERESHSMFWVCVAFGRSLRRDACMRWGSSEAFQKSIATVSTERERGILSSFIPIFYGCFLL